MSPTGELYCPPGTNYNPKDRLCYPSLNDIAAAQQAVVNKQRGNSALVAQTGLDPLMKGKYSFDSNPTSPPWVTMPDGGYPIGANGTINTPVAASGWTDVIGPNGQYVMQVPNGYDGVIDTLVCFYNGQGFVSGSGSLIWRILINGQAVRNYDNILVQLGVAPFPGNIAGIRLAAGDGVQFQVSNVSLVGAGTQVFCFLGGWYYPSKLS